MYFGVKKGRLVQYLFKKNLLRNEKLKILIHCFENMCPIAAKLTNVAQENNTN